MHPLIARFHDEPAFFASEKKTLMESLLSSAAAQMDTPMFRETQASASNDNLDWWGEPGSFLSYLRPYIVKDGVLQIPVKGVLLNGFPFAFGDYATGYDYIWKAFQRGMDDGNVKGIAFVINSPGGEVAGNFDLVDKIFAMRGTKPIRAFAAEYAYSAAYSIASVADKIIVSRTGGVGSIGVLTSHVSVEEAYKKLGIEVTYIFAGKHKVDGNPFEALSPDVKARIQSRIDELYDVFVSSVARNRDMEEKAIRKTEALTFTATQALDNGLADAIGSLDDATAEFVSDLENGDMDMAYTPAEQKAHDEGRTAGKTEGHAAGVTEGQATGRADGIKAENERINGILGCEGAKKRPIAALAAALETNMTVEQANTFLGKLPEEKPAVVQGAAPGGKPKSDFEKAMDQAEHPEAGQAGEGGNGQGAGDGGTPKVSRAKAALANSSVPRRQRPAA